MSDKAFLFTIAQTLLEACKEALTAADLAIPERAFIADGDVAFDCSTLAVGLAGLQPGLPGAPPSGAMQAQVTYGRSAQFRVIFALCVPTVTNIGENQVMFPGAEEITASAERVMSYAWVIFQAIFDAWRSGELPDQCASMSWTQGVPIGPEGGLAGWDFTFGLQLTDVAT